MAVAPCARPATTVSWPFWRTAGAAARGPWGLAEISVDDLAKGAGISRPTFYFYFPSKDAVLLTLLDRVITEADERARRGRSAAQPTKRSTRPGCGERDQCTVRYVRRPSRGDPLAGAAASPHQC